MTEFGFRITTVVSLTVANDLKDRYTTRVTANQALYALISHLDDFRQMCELEMTQLASYETEEVVRPWVRVIEEAEAKLDAVISLHRNSQLDTFLSFGLLFKFKTPDGEVLIKLDQNRPGC